MLGGEQRAAALTHVGLVCGGTSPQPLQTPAQRPHSRPQRGVRGLVSEVGAGVVGRRGAEGGKGRAARLARRAPLRAPYLPVSPPASPDISSYLAGRAPLRVPYLPVSPAPRISRYLPVSRATCAAPRQRVSSGLACRSTASRRRPRRRRCAWCHTSPYRVLHLPTSPRIPPRRCARCRRAAPRSAVGSRAAQRAPRGRGADVSEICGTEGYPHATLRAAVAYMPLEVRLRCVSCVHRAAP